MCDGSAKLFDFGYSRESDVDEDSRSWAWMAPELDAKIRPELRSYTQASDVFRCGLRLVGRSHYNGPVTVDTFYVMPSCFPPGLHFAQHQALICLLVDSFGVLMCELTSESGAVPFPSAWSDEDVKTNVDNGFRLPKSPSCSSSVYDLFRRCWNKAPEARPTFAVLNKDLQSIGDVLPPAERTVMSTAMAAIPSLTTTSVPASQVSLNPAAGLKIRRRSSNVSEDWNQISVLGKLNREVAVVVLVLLSPYSNSTYCRYRRSPLSRQSPLCPTTTKIHTIPWPSPLSRATLPPPEDGWLLPETRTPTTPTWRMLTSLHGGHQPPPAKITFRCSTLPWIPEMERPLAYPDKAQWRRPSARACGWHVTCPTPNSKPRHPSVVPCRSSTRRG